MRERGFELAVKKVKGEVVGDGSWGIDDSYLPVYKTTKSAGADFMCAEDVVIPSIWGYSDRDKTPTDNMMDAFKDANLDYHTYQASIANDVAYDEVTEEQRLKAKSAGVNFGLHHRDKDLGSLLDGVIRNYKPTLVHTGIKAYMLDDEVLELYNRSSNPSKLGIVLANGVGVVDSDYYSCEDNDGEIMFAFYNFFPCDVVIKKGERIGQGVFKKFLRPDKAVVDNSVRVGGFGSTES